MNYTCLSTFQGLLWGIFKFLQTQYIAYIYNWDGFIWRIVSEFRPRCYKAYSYSTQLSTKFVLLINVKMPTIVGILTCISMIIATSERLKAIHFLICFIFFSFYEQLSWDEHEKSFITSGPGWIWIITLWLGAILKMKCTMCPIKLNQLIWYWYLSTKPRLKLLIPPRSWI